MTSRATKLTVWDEIGFRERVLEVARLRGLNNLKEVAHEARLDPKYFREHRAALPDGRNVRHVLQIAEALEADPAFLLGLTDSPPLPNPAADALDRVAFVASIAAHLYAAMARRRPPDRADCQKLAKMVVDILDYTDPETS